MMAELTDAVAEPQTPDSRVPSLAEELILQISANSLQEQTIAEAKALSEEGKRQLARSLLKRNLEVALIYNSNMNSTRGPIAELPYRV